MCEPRAETVDTETVKAEPLLAVQETGGKRMQFWCDWCSVQGVS